MKKFYSKLFISVLVISLLGVNNLFAGFFSKSKDIKVTGSTTVLPIAQKCAEIYMNQNSKIKITVSGGGSGVGIAALIDKKCDVANSSRKIKVSEEEKAKNNNVLPWEYVIAKDAIAIVVNKNVTGVTSLTLDQLKKIYTGKIKNWKELGGSDEKIMVVSRDTSSGTYEAFETLVVKGEKVIPEALMLASNNAVATTVSTTPFAIGYVGIGFIDAAEMTVVNVEKITPSKETVLNKKYPIARDLYMYTDNRATGEIKKFIDFILSGEGQKIIEEEGFVAIK